MMHLTAFGAFWLAELHLVHQRVVAVRHDGGWRGAGSLARRRRLVIATRA